jgi:dihydrofolate reductase
VPRRLGFTLSAIIPERAASPGDPSVELQVWTLELPAVRAHDINLSEKPMRKVVVTNNMSLDGVMQAPGRADEDTRDGFQHGGWALPYNDAVKGQAMAEGMSTGGGLLFGRRTYEDFFKVWPGRKDNPFTAVLDNTPKYVASTTLQEPLPWKNSTLLRGDVADARQTQASPAGTSSFWAAACRTIADATQPRRPTRIAVHPLVLGRGRRLFADDGEFAKLRLVKA